MEALKHDIRQFIISNFLFGQGEDKLEDGESFLDRGIVDSTGVLELVGFLQERYNIRISDDELVPDNLDSVDLASAFVQRKLNG
jgi:acyl carrier protein